MRFKWLGIIEMSLYKDKGWDYLTSGSQDADFYCDYDGSWGNINPDGSSTYYGTDGSWENINSDGNSSYFEGNKRVENEGEFYDEDDEDDTNITTAGNGIAALLGLAIGFGIPLYMAYKMQKLKKNVKKWKSVLSKSIFGKKSRKSNRKKEKYETKDLKHFYLIRKISKQVFHQMLWLETMWNM